MTSARVRWLCAIAALAVITLTPGPAPGACCYFSAKNAEIVQPAQQVFITWDPKKGVESFTVQPRFKGNALDFGMVIPTPARPKLDEMPRDFFKSLAVYTILKRREQPPSRLVGVQPERPRFGGGARPAGERFNGKRPSTVKVVEAGVVGSLDYKTIEAGRADDLYAWLKANKYHYAGDEATLDFYVKKKWLFTVMKIDTLAMKKNKDGFYTGEVTPTRFQFASDRLIYPLKITQLSVKDKTEALIYVQTSYKVDLPGDMTYQYQWVPMLQNARIWYAQGIFGTKDLPGKADDWLEAIKDQTPKLLRRGQELGFAFQSGTGPQPNNQGRIATTLEWAKKLTADDIKVLKGDAPYSEKVPNVDEGFTAADLKDPKKAEAVYKVILERLAKYRKERPSGYLVREAPNADIKLLKLLVGHLKEGLFLTKLRKTFTRGDMNDDLLIVPARLGQAEDSSEYQEILPTREAQRT
jgi:hypothetical protein